MTITIAPERRNEWRPSPGHEYSTDGTLLYFTRFTCRACGCPVGWFAFTREDEGDERRNQRLLLLDARIDRLCDVCQEAEAARLLVSGILGGRPQ